MLRAALTALCLATVTIGCGGGNAGPPVIAGAPAGDVVEVSGTVTAVRAGVPRTLAVGDSVAGDEEFDTGSDGRVRITLRHNQVAWTLGPKQHERVASSLAWRAPKASGVAAGPTGERSGAAGRHAEREAADTSATATAEVATGAAAPKADPAAAAPAVAAVDMAPPAAPPTPAATTDEEAAKPVAKPAEMGEMRGAALGDESAGGGLGMRGTGLGGGGTGDGPGLGAIGTLGHGGGSGSGYGAGAGAGARPKRAANRTLLRVLAAKGALSTTVVGRVVKARSSRFYACLEADGGGRGVTRLVIGADGKVTDATVTGVGASTATCVSKWMRALAFPKAASPTTASVIVEVSGDGGAPDL